MDPRDFWGAVIIAGSPLIVIIVFHILRINNLLPAWVFAQ